MTKLSRIGRLVGVVALVVASASTANAGIIGHDGSGKIYRAGGSFGFGGHVFTFVNAFSPTVGGALVDLGLLN